MPLFYKLLVALFGVLFAGALVVTVAVYLSDANNDARVIVLGAPLLLGALAVLAWQEGRRGTES